MTKLNYLFTLLATGSIFCSQAQKKPLDHSVYDRWESIGAKGISNDGKWILYSVTPQQGDAVLNIYHTATKKTLQINRVTDADFTEDSRYAAFLIKPFYQETRKAKIKKKKADELPQDSLGITDLATATTRKFADVKSYKLPEKASHVIAFQLANKKASAKKDTGATAAGNTESAAKDSAVSGRKSPGSDLVILKLRTNISQTFKYVTDYQISKDGAFVAFICSENKKEKAKAGTFLYNTSTGILKTLSTGLGTYKNLTFDESGKQLAFTAEKDPAKAPYKFYKLFYYTAAKDSAIIIADKNTRGIPDKWSISGDGKILFSKNGQKLFFGLAPVAASKDTSIVDFEVAKVDIWNYKDDYLMPSQLKNLDKELKRSYTAVIYPQKPLSVIPLCDETMPEIQLGDEGNAEYALAVTDFGNRVEAQWNASTLNDAYLISTVNGKKLQILQRSRGMASLSPGGNYVSWYDESDRAWNCYNIKEGKKLNLSKNLSVNFYDEDNDVPDEPSAYGSAGWLKDDKRFLVYDRYDIWSFDPSGKEKARRITNGRPKQIIFRYDSFSGRKKERGGPEVIETSGAVFFSATNELTKEHGWYTKNLSNTKDAEQLSFGPYSWSTPKTAKNAAVFIYEKSNYKLPPDLYLSSDFKKEIRLSSINRQQDQYNWGTAELVKWTTPKGYKSEGILYKPENFDSSKTYPMVVYFYEKLSNTLYNYIPPAPTPSRLNISYFVSNGYLVFAPDIQYEIGHPGKSAEEFINSGVEYLKKNSWVDGKHIGIQGQSWGGYQVAHLITATNMYAAAWAGAPVVNMTSAYGGIRWETGRSRQFQYEKTQSRIGATLWEKPELYIENSPLFQLPKVNTPVAIMANDADGAVPWYQGIEMFTALRRLGKPVWLLVYNDEAHNLVQRQNRKDIQVREQQFFDHYLKGKPAPLWMTKGVPATLKGINWGFELSEEGRE